MCKYTKHLSTSNMYVDLHVSKCALMVLHTFFSLSVWNVTKKAFTGAFTGAFTALITCADCV